MDRPILGLVEPVKLLGKKSKVVRARIDTGATKSSIDMSLSSQLDLGPTIRERLVKSASGNKVRPIIKATIELNGQEMTGEFSLADRRHLSYPVLIGQNILKKGKFMIDPLKSSGSTITE